MPITDTSALGDTIPTIIEEAQFTMQFKAIMRGLCWNIKKGKGSTVNVPYFGEATSNQLQEGVDMTASEQMVDTNVQVTPYEAGLKIILTKTVVEDDNEDLIRAAGTLLGDAYEKKVDVDLAEKLVNGTNTLGGASTTLTMGHLAAARAILAGNPTTNLGPAPTPYVAVLHPYQALDIVDVVTPLLPAAGNTQSVGSAMFDDILRNYSVGRLFGMPIIEDGNLPFIAGSTDIKAGVFAQGQRGALIYVPARQPQIEEEYDASLRGWELNYVGRYGCGNYAAGWLATLHIDATTPT
jgi:hypothetical protein